VVKPADATPPVDRMLAERWPSWVDGVRGRRRALASLLEHARPLTFTAGQLTLGFVRGDFHARSLGESLAAAEALLSEVAGEPVRVKVLELEAGAAQQVSSMAESADRAEREAREARLKAGREHPEIVAIVELLGGEVEEVRDLAGSAA
jgi:hypothetical protein